MMIESMMHAGQENIFLFSESNVKETGKKLLLLKRSIRLAAHPADYDRDASMRISILG